MHIGNSGHKNTFLYNFLYTLTLENLFFRCTSVSVWSLDLILYLHLVYFLLDLVTGLRSRFVLKRQIHSHLFNIWQEAFPTSPEVI